MQKITWYGKDGGAYNTPQEKTAADTRYNQNREIINQLRIANGQKTLDQQESEIFQAIILILLSPFIFLYKAIKGHKQKKNIEQTTEIINETKENSEPQIKINFFNEDKK